MTRYPEVLVKLFAAILLALFAPLAFATDLTLSCTPPTQFAPVPPATTGTPITPGTTFTYNFYGAVQGQPLKLLNPTPLAICKSVRANVDPGTLCYSMTVFATAPGLTVSPESAQFMPLQCFTSIAATPTPAPPGGVTVTPATTSTIAYGLAPAHDRLAFLIVGSVPLGTACLPDQTANAYRAVPVATVSFNAPYKPTTVPTVFALCSG